MSDYDFKRIAKKIDMTITLMKSKRIDKIQAMKLLESALEDCNICIKDINETAANEERLVNESDNVIQVDFRYARRVIPKASGE